MIRAWRMSKKFSLKEAARYLGLKSVGALSEIERGITFPEPKTAVQIEAATLGQVTCADHAAAWRRSHRQEWNLARAAGRKAVGSYE